jgi:pimeloyl-ACP methyl ester carboxylesterase
MGRGRVSRIAGFFLVLAGTAALAQPQNPAQVRRIPVNGVELEYVEQGRGVPVVFVHGAVGDLRYWEPQREAFAKGYRFVAYTLRYHGTGPWPDEGKQFTAQQHAADLAGLIKGLKAGPVHLVGLSYGGLLTTMVALDHPDLVRTLILAEPALHPLLAETPDGKPALEEWNKALAPMAPLIKSGDNAGAVRHLSAVVTGGSVEDFDSIPAGFRQVLLDNARTLPLIFAAPETPITCDMLRSIKAPTLIVRGEATPRVFAKVNENAGRCIAGSKAAVIPKASHPMSYDNPAGFNRAVMEFLRQATKR